MIPLSRGRLRAIVPGAVVPFNGQAPLQTFLGGCPWRVAMASMLLCRTRRMQAEPVLRRLLQLYPSAAHLAHAEDLEDITRPCGLYRTRARQMQRFSVQWLGDYWSELRELSGVGLYVADAVGLFCLGCTDLESGDHVLVAYAKEVTSGVSRHDG